MSNLGALKVSIYIFILTLSTATAQETALKCQTPSVPNGDCVLLKDCPSLIPITDEISIGEFLRRYGCGVHSDGTRLCCPEAKGTPTHTIINGPLPGPSQDRSKCGRRAVGQGPEWPFVAAVGRLLRQRGFTYYCNGAFLNEQWVLVDSFCIVQYHISHVIPAFAWHNGQTREFTAVVDTRLHEYADDGTYAKGVALLKLEKPLTFNDYVQSACLPDPNANDNVLLNAITLVNEGAVNKPVKRVSAQSCGSISIPGLDSSRNPLYMCVTGVKLCLTGDIRSPLVVEEDINTGQYQIRGLGGSSSYICLDEANAYSDVKPHLEWLNQQMRDGSLSTVTSSGQVHGFNQCGQPAVEDGPMYPFMVALGKRQNGNFVTSCGGVIINPSWILTDAACIVDNFISHATIGLRSTSERIVTIAQRKRHPSYDPVTRVANIGLLKLENPIIFDEDVQPVCLPSTFDFPRNVMSAVAVFVQRGSSQQKAFPVFRGGECRESNADTICASGVKICISTGYATDLVLLRRDSHNKFSVEGVGGSSAYPCLDEGQGYTRVINYLQWINDSL